LRFLLDTHAFLWFFLDDPQLSATAKALITDPTNEVLVSPASYWEVAIKVSLGKYPLTVPFEEFWTAGINGSGFVVPPIGLPHASILSSLPMHHKDPFDRMIISQAIAEQIPVVSADAAFNSYAVTRLW
jgi:PIN domain nuclease of toxin-antitoxin system